MRLVLRPFTFSNGVTIPTGTLITIPGSGPHKEEAIYHDPYEFDGFRFVKLRESLGEGDTLTSRFQSASASGKQLAFGLGRHAW
jgi:cytochrome P450